jgi:uncharacterized membrane protein YhaH (DUF805 family)
MERAMDFPSLFTRLDGRIARKPFWLAVIVLAVAVTIAFFLLSAVLPPEPVLLLITLALLYPSIALVVKRLHDHGLPAMPYAAIFIAPSFAANLLQVLGVTATTLTVGGTSVPTLTPLGWMVQIVVLLVGLWALWLLGLKRGQETDNAYGPDPLAA